MTTEQRVRVDRLERYLITDRGKTYTRVRVNDLDTALSLIKEQQEEIENLQKELNEENNRCMILANNDKFKEQMIDLMAEYIASLDIEEDICANIENNNCDKMALGEYENCIKQYFANKVNSKIQ